jgi:hypothetical protein
MSTENDIIELALKIDESTLLFDETKLRFDKLKALIDSDKKFFIGRVKDIKYKEHDLDILNIWLGELFYWITIWKEQLEEHKK